MQGLGQPAGVVKMESECLNRSREPIEWRRDDRFGTSWENEGESQGRGSRRANERVVRFKGIRLHDIVM